MEKPITDKPADVITAFVKIGKEARMFTLAFSDFKTVYFRIRSENPDLKLDIILNGDWALAQFSEVCNHRIRIVPDNHFHSIKRALGYRLYIDEKDLEFASPFVRVFGQRNRFTFMDFLKEEIEVNGIKAAITFILSLALLSFLVRGNETLLSTVNQVVISVATIFFAIFILFTASQNLQTFSNSNLFSKGASHRFMSVDKYISRLSIFTIWVTALNVALSLSPQILQIAVFPTLFYNFTLKDVLIITTSLVIVSMFVAMFTVEQYYFERIRYIYETDNSKGILDKRFNDENSEGN